MSEEELLIKINEAKVNLDDLQKQLCNLKAQQWYDSIKSHPGYKPKSFEENLSAMLYNGRPSYRCEHDSGKELKLDINAINAIQYWKVTTEGDCEGKSIKHYGVFKGTLQDIAVFLINQKYQFMYGFQFMPLWFGEEIDLPIQEVGYQELDEQKLPRCLELSLWIGSGTWDLEHEDRISFFKKLFANSLDKYIEKGASTGVKCYSPKERL